MGLNIFRISQREWRLDVRCKRNGKEARRRETFHGTQVQAEERYFQIKRELKDGPTGSAPILVGTLGDLLERYRANRGGGIPRSQRSVFFAVLDTLGSVPLAVIADALPPYAATLRNHVSKRTGKRLSHASINRHRAVINAALNLGVALEVMERNPMTKARFPKLKEIPRDRVLSPGDLQRLLKTVDIHAPHLGPLVRYNLLVPSRKAELVNMRREDLDLTHNAIRVRNGTTKNDAGLWKPIPPDMVAYFRSIPPECPWAFYRVEGGRYVPLGDFKRAWRKCLDLAGITDFRFHDGRHIAASALVDNGTPEQVVMSVAGWKTNMLRTYYHRAGKSSLNLIKFPSGSGRLADSQEDESGKSWDSERKTASLKD